MSALFRRDDCRTRVWRGDDGLWWWGCRNCFRQAFPWALSWRSAYRSAYAHVYGREPWPPELMLAVTGFKRDAAGRVTWQR